MQLPPKGTKEFRERTTRFGEGRGYDLFPILGLTTTYSPRGLTVAGSCTTAPSYLFALFQRVKEARERAVPAHGSRWLELPFCFGCFQWGEWRLRHLCCSSKGIMSCEIEQLAKHRSLVSVTPI